MSRYSSLPGTVGHQRRACNPLRRLAAVMAEQATEPVLTPDKSRSRTPSTASATPPPNVALHMASPGGVFGPGLRTMAPETAHLSPDAKRSQAGQRQAKWPCRGPPTRHALTVACDKRYAVLLPRNPDKSDMHFISISPYVAPATRLLEIVARSLSRKWSHSSAIFSSTTSKRISKRRCGVSETLTQLESAFGGHVSGA